jgi:tRNA(Ile)-lysidine synthase
VPSFPLHLTVAHFDHGWRPDSAGDAQFVEDLAHRWGYPAVTARADPALRHTEAVARNARYQFLREAAARTGSAVIALGHTRDDQVETLLLHLLRGSGSRGLAAMRHRNGDLARPLLDIPRADLESYLTGRGLTARRDSTNDDPRFARNRLRQVMLPAIDAFAPSARRLLAQTAEILGDEDRLLEDQVDQLGTGILAARPAFESLPPALQRRLLRRHNPEAGFLETEARRRRGDADPAPVPIPTAPPELLISTCACDRAGFRANDRIGHLDADRVQMPLRVVSRNPGDRMQPLGMDQAKRLQDILVDARVPRHLRDALPIVCDREEIVWIPAVSVAERKRVTAQTSRQLHLEIASS